jgi:exosortase/archaeosortase family protein
VLWLDLIRLLSTQWEAREQYAYGWFVPFFAAALLWRRWLDRPGSEAGGQRSEVRGQKSEVRGQKSEVSRSSLGTPLTSDLCPPTSAFRPPFLLSALCFLLFLLLPLRVIYEINRDWPLISWLYTLIVVALTLYAFHLAGSPPVVPGPRSTVPGPRSTVHGPWSSLSPWVRHFAFPVCFILVAVVWPYRIEKGLTQGLMRVVANLTVELLGWLDIPALQRGNLIELATGTVGVDEACSGIRSFQSSLMAALLMGELYRLRLWPRAALVAIGITLGFCFNVVRTLILSWQANAHGISAIEKWHDPAGLTITVACFLSLWAIAVLLKKRTTHHRLQTTDQGPKTKDQGPKATDQPQVSGFIPHPAAQPQLSAFIPHPSSSSPLISDLRPLTSGNSDSQPSTLNSQPLVPPASDLRPLTSSSGAPPVSSQWSVVRSPRAFMLACGLWSLFCIGTTEAWYRSHDIRPVETTRWWVNYPTNSPSYQPISISHAAQKMLKYDYAGVGSWTEMDGTQWSVFCLRWNAGDPTARMSAQAHRPEYCMTGSGHQMNAELGTKYIPASGLNLPFRTYIFDAAERPLYVFFCLWEDGAESQVGFGKSKQGDRLRSVLDRRRGLGQQTLEIICSGYQGIEQAQAAVTARLPELIKLETTDH